MRLSRSAVHASTITVGKSFSTVLLAAVLVVSIVASSPTFSKYVLDKMETEFGFISGILGTPLKSIGPIEGTTMQFQMLTAGEVLPEGATFDYIWQRADSLEGPFINIPNSNVKDYGLVFDDNNRYIRVAAVGKGQYTNTVYSYPVGPVVISATPITDLGPITGAVLAGSTLTAGDVTPGNATVTWQWKISDTANGEYVNISGATLNTLLLTEDMSTKYIRVYAKGSGTFSGEKYAQTGPIHSALTPIAAIDSIIGATKISQTITAGALTPSGATATYQWQISDITGTIFTDISGATNNTYTVNEEELGLYYRVVATGTGLYTGTVNSVRSSQVVENTIDLTGIGNITGQIKVGEIVTVSTIVPQEATVTYQWEISDSGSGPWSNISGANSSSYSIKPEDFGKYLRLVATGSGSYSGVQPTASVGPIAAMNLVSIANPSGTTIVGHVLTAGVLNPVNATVTYVWERANTINGTYSTITGATDETYTLIGDDSGKYVRVKAIGNGAYTGSVNSQGLQISPVSQDATSLTGIADSTGIAQVFSSLTAGTVSPYGATATYQWYRSETQDGTYTAVPGATGKTINLTGSDLGYYFKVTATGSGAYTGTVTSKFAGPITRVPLISLGNIGGTAQVGKALSAGSVQPAGATVDYQWLRSDENGENYTPINGATSETYVVTSGDENRYLKVQVIGKNYYTGTLLSDFSGPVLVNPVPITNLGPINGNPEVGRILNAGPTTPAGATVTYQWLKADTQNGAYSAVIGATEATYTVKPEDLGKYFKLQIWGSGKYITGEEGITSEAFGPILSRSITAISNIIGKSQVGQILTAGTVTPLGATVTYQWRESNSPTSGFTNISGATSNTFTITSSQSNKYIRVEVIGQNGYTGSAISNPTGPVGSPNLISNITDITGTTQVGQTLTAGVVLPHGATVSYIWRRSPALDGVYEIIEGATSKNYVLTAEDQDKHMQVVAIGFGQFYGEAYSMPTDLVAKGVLTSIENIQGQSVVGQTLAAGSVLPTGATVTYQWQIDNGSGFTNIAGATSNNILLIADYEGKPLRVVATGTGAYEGIVNSQITQNISASGTSTTPITNIGNTTGTLTVGQTLTAGSVTPGGATYTIKWQRSSSQNSGYVDIPGAISSTYTLTGEDYNLWIRPTVTGTALYTGNVSATGVRATGKQSIISISNITGANYVGGTVLAGDVTPDGATVTYQWQRALFNYRDGWSYTNISGETNPFYIVRSADEDAYLRLVVTGTGGYTGTATSAVFGEIEVSPFLVTAISNISGESRVGEQLMAGQTTPFGANVTYQWYKKDPEANTYTPISGATNKSYTIQAADYNTIIKVIATGSGGYTGLVESAPTSIVQKASITEITTIIGATAHGEVLLAGTVKPVGATVQYQWYKASTIDGQYLPIEGAVTGSYEIGNDPNDLGSFIKVEAIGYGSYSGSVFSSPTGPIIEQSTNLTSINNFTGTLRVHSTLTAGAVVPAQATVTYQWQRAVATGGPYIDIPGATNNTYELTPDDWDKYIRVQAKGIGAYKGTVTSGNRGKITPFPITEWGQWTGNLRVGQSVVAGEVQPPGATVTYEWQVYLRDWLLFWNWRVMGTTTQELLISEQLEGTQFLGERDLQGKRLRVVVTGTGAYSGSTTYELGAIGAPYGSMQSLTSIDPVKGTTAVGQTLTVGTVKPIGADVNYQWQRAAGPNETFSNIGGATNTTYTVTASDLGYYFRVVAIGKNNFSGVVASATKGPVVNLNETIPITSISDILYSTSLGETLSAGTVTPYGAEVTYQWYKSNTTNQNGAYTPISGATEATFTIPMNQATGYYYKVEATGTGQYSGTIMSNYTGPVVQNSTPLISVDIDGTVQVGETLSAVNLLPAGATATYQWQVFTGVGGVYADILGATSSVYTLQPEQFNYFIKVIVAGSGAYTGTVEASTDVPVVGIIETAQISMEAPVVGATPQTIAQVEAQTSSVDYVVTDLVWNEDLTPEGKFKASQNYSATVTITSKNHKTILGNFTPIVPGSFAIEPLSIVVSGTGVGNTAEFTVSFSPTSELGVISIAVETQATKMVYIETEDGMLALDGLVVKEYYNDGSVQTVVFSDFLPGELPTGYETYPPLATALTGDWHNVPILINHLASGTTTLTTALTVEAPPKGQDLSVDGKMLNGETLTGQYTYFDVNGDLEGESTYRWLADANPIVGATALTYELTAAEVGKIITFEVLPVALTGPPSTLTGTASSFSASYPVAAGEIASVNVVTSVAPKAGEVPFSYAGLESATSHSDFTVTGLVWSQALAPSGRFEADTTYTATITLTSKNNKTFAESGVTAGLTGAGLVSVGSSTVTGTGVGNTVTFDVTFVKTAQLSSIDVTSQPTQLTYKEMTNEILDLAGLKVTETYSDNSTIETVFVDGEHLDYEVSPSQGSVLTVADDNGNPVLITHYEGLTANTANITVTEQHAPVFVGSVTISGTQRVSNELTAVYNYNDVDGDDEDTSVNGTTFQWLRNDVAIAGATNKTYTLTTTDRGTQISVRVQLKAEQGIIDGEEKTSAKTGTILQTISSVITSASFPAPVDNVLRTDSFETTEYSATVTWNYGNNSTDWRRSGIFSYTYSYRSGKTYVATITITPKANYTLAGLTGSNAFSHENQARQGSITFDGNKTIVLGFTITP